MSVARVPVLKEGGNAAFTGPALIVTVVLWVSAHMLLKAVRKEKKDIEMIRPIASVIWDKVKLY